MSNIFIIPTLNEIEKSCFLAEEWKASFEYNDFFLPEILDDEKTKQKIIKIYKEIGRDTVKDTLHGAFFDITLHSGDKKIREVSRQRIYESMEIAEELNVKAVIFHTNFIPGFELKSYKDMWIEENMKFWEKVLLQYPKKYIYLENMFDQTPELLARLARGIKNKRFGVCFDYAHGAITNTPIKEWVSQLYPYIKHLHINDNDYKQDLHLPIGMGNIDWKEYNNHMIMYHINCPVLIEVKGIEQQKNALKYMKEKGIFPFNDSSL